MRDAYVGFGSNIDPAANIRRALEALARRCEIAGVSTVYRSAALDRPADAEFLNGVVHLRTSLGARELKLGVLRPIEAELGRRRGADAYAPRTIDLDLLLCGRGVVREPDLVVPNPDIARRAYVGVPLAELAPDLVLPDTGRMMSELFSDDERGLLRPDAEFSRQIKELFHGPRED